VIVFWLLLQFSRSLRVLREAARSPVGCVPSAVMLHARVRKGMSLTEVISLTHSLGRRAGDAPETWVWADAGGDKVALEFEAGRCVRWMLQRATANETA
jgi:hypothetical protein